MLTRLLWYNRLTRFEFWPYWVFYFPFLFYGLYLAVKSSSLAYFTRVNPGMHMSGLVGEEKLNMLARLAPEYLPKTLLITTYQSTDEITTRLIAHNLHFPLIIKPNIGERGIGVEPLHNKEALIYYLKTHTGSFLLQEYITYPIELGVLHYRLPNGKSGISSVVQKEFLSITGNGKTTLSDLIAQHERATTRRQYLNHKFKHQLDEIPANGETMLLEPIGNHNRGTIFLDATPLITNQLVATFDAIAAPLNGFYYGRFDLKVPSIADLYAGKNIRILEINGVASEPAHIYHPYFGLLNAYKVVKQHMDIIYEISAQNKQKGVKTIGIGNLLNAIVKHLAARNKYTT